MSPGESLASSRLRRLRRQVVWRLLSAEEQRRLVFRRAFLNGGMFLLLPLGLLVISGFNLLFEGVELLVGTGKPMAVAAHAAVACLGLIWLLVALWARIRGGLEALARQHAEVVDPQVDAEMARMLGRQLEHEMPASASATSGRRRL